MKVKNTTRSPQVLKDGTIVPAYGSAEVESLHPDDRRRLVDRRPVLRVEGEEPPPPAASSEAKSEMRPERSVRTPAPPVERGQPEGTEDEK